MNYYLFVLLLVWFFKTEYSREDKAKPSASSEKQRQLYT